MKREPTETGENKVKILIQNCTGHHLRWGIEFNKGGVAVPLSAIETLRKLIPDAEFVTFIQFSQAFSIQHNLKVIRNRLFLYKAFSLFESLRSSLRLIRCMLWAILHKYVHIDINMLIKDKQLKEVRRADIVIDLSGEHYSDNCGVISVIEHSKDILIATLLGKPIMIYAQSIGPLRTKLSSRLARFTLNRASLITLREEISRGYLQEVGVNKPPIYVTADPAFLLEPAHEARVKEILLKEGIDKSDKPLVGICVGRNTPLGETKRSPKYKKITRSISYGLGYCLPEKLYQLYHRLTGLIKQVRFGSNVKSGYANNIRKTNKSIAQIADYLAEKFDATVLLISHIIVPRGQGEREEVDERVLAEAIYQMVSKKDKVKPISGEYTAEEVKGIIGQCDLFISMKMHACIAAMTQLVPTIPIAYGYKFYGISRMLGQEEMVCDKISTEELIPKIEDAWIHREEIKNELRAKVGAAKQRALFNAKLAKELLESYGKR